MGCLNENRPLRIPKMVVLSTFSAFFNYECSFAEVSIIELTAYTLDELIFGLCASKYGCVCM